MTAILKHDVLNAFSCLGDTCPDTCCVNWSMLVDEGTLERYRAQAPELLDAVEKDETGDITIMKKDPVTRFCIKYDDGLCGLHKDMGERFLGDACHFYPRITRRLGDTVMMTAALSCPEVTRLALSGAVSAHFTPADEERLPYQVKEYLPQGLTDEQAIATHQAFLQAALEETVSPEQLLLRMASASRSLERLEAANWPVMAAFYINNADMRIPKAQPNINDPFNLLHALAGLIVASHKPASKRLKGVLTVMEQALCVRLDWATAHIDVNETSPDAYHAMQALWQEQRAYYAPYLRRWLHMQLSASMYPFAGFGQTLPDRITVIGVRMATLRLALMCAHTIYKGVLPEDAIVEYAQSLARFMDHLADPAFSMKIYTETGWNQEARLAGLLA